ncbi:hypothetical protein O4J56_27170 [Nocardiopsis sp. RSe5-2]|uniref:SRPBCC family protein n=1 Tax=Nocardiopsis endophytica TaxID=3018445 RepID=A0ABT4UBS0_9ACTN|nr:hypothetical protein [Nocardiopsis endophytica]MDA2814358.1 hypothetical protein [Nocardiopsis endophytica]
MRWLRPTVPREVRDRLRLERGERVLAHAESRVGPLVSTDRALHLPDGRRVPWQDIDRARWDADGEAFTFTEEGAGEHVYAVPDPGRLAETVHERVTATIVVSHRGELPEGGAGFRLVARRPPGGTEVDWRVHLDDGLDPDDPRVREAVRHELAAVRERTGV